MEVQRVLVCRVYASSWSW